MFGPAVQNEARQKPTVFCQENTLVIANILFQNTRDSSTHGYHHIVNTETRLMIFFAAKGGEALYSQQKTRPGADCGSVHELLIAKFRLKLKKAGKTTRPFKKVKVGQSCPTLCDPHGL